MRFLCIPVLLVCGLAATAAPMPVRGAAVRTESTPRPTPVLYYRLTVAAGDTTGYGVELRIDNAPPQFQLAMATHIEYDDRFWRYVRDFKVESGTAERRDNSLYIITAASGDKVVIRYRIELPQHLYAHRPFLSSFGGLVGDLHSFFYMAGYEQLRAKVKFELPAGWRIATGLEPTADSTVWKAPSVVRLLDCPVLVGWLKEWRFELAGIPYTVAYLPAGGGSVFDTALLVSSIRKIAEQAVGLFGGAPYKHYTYQLIDGVYGALEHANSVTIGAPAVWLATRMQECYTEIAHEFFHTWNLVNIRPDQYMFLTYGTQQQSPLLWFSEGVTMYYADVLLRRAGLPTEDSSRVAHLASVIRRYYADTGNRVFPPERVSLAENAPPGALGDYTASIHVQGELLGAMLDMLIGYVSGGRRSLDDVMRLMYKRFGGKKGIWEKDVEKAVAKVCGRSDSVHAFFEDYVYQGRPLDPDRYLRLTGLRLAVSWAPAVDEGGRPLPDKRFYVWQRTGDTAFSVLITDPRSCWGKAGLHTGDVLLTIDGQAVSSRSAFYDVMERLRIGDTVEVRLRGKPAVQVIVSGYAQPKVRLVAL